MGEMYFFFFKFVPNERLESVMYKKFAINYSHRCVFGCSFARFIINCCQFVRRLNMHTRWKIVGIVYADASTKWVWLTSTIMPTMIFTSRENYDFQTHKMDVVRPKRFECTSFGVVTLKTTKQIEVHHFQLRCCVKAMCGTMDNLSFWDA